MTYEWTRALTPVEAAREAKLKDSETYGGWYMLFGTSWGYFLREYRAGEAVVHIKLVRDDRQLRLEER